jgi:hypothetical protein
LPDAPQNIPNVSGSSGASLSQAAVQPQSFNIQTSSLPNFPTFASPKTSTMVCAKCQKLSKSTTLATPAVKKKSEMYYGSPAGSSKSGDKTKTSATLGNNGIGKVRFTTCLVFFNS